jgi:hypothetical protein
MTGNSWPVRRDFVGDAVLGAAELPPQPQERGVDDGFVDNDLAHTMSLAFVFIVLALLWLTQPGDYHKPCYPPTAR